MTPPSPLRRVLMTTDAVGGVWQYSLELSRALAQRGVEVVLAAMGPAPSESQRREVAALENVTFEESTYRLEWMDDPWVDVERAGEWLRELEWRHCPDVIHLNGYVHATLPWRAPTLVVAHSCVLSWWRHVRREEPPERWNEYLGRVTAGVQAAGEVVAPTHAMLRSIASEYGRRERMRVIANGRDAAAFLPRAEKEPFILSVGRIWDDAKNVRVLAACAGELDWPIQIAGDATGPDGRTVDLADVTLLGRCAPAELAGQYARAAIYALPARYEPFGLSALEAALSGCALVLGDVPSLREVWADAAVFVAPDDRAGWRDALQALIRDETRRRELAARARRRGQEFSVTRMVDAYLDAYRRLLAARPAARVATEPLA